MVPTSNAGPGETNRVQYLGANQPVAASRAHDGAQSMTDATGDERKRLRPHRRPASRMAVRDRCHDQRPMRDVKLPSGLDPDQNRFGQRSSRRISEEFADRTVPRIVRHGDRTRLARMRVRQLDIRAISRVVGSAAMTAVAGGIRRTSGRALPTMQSRPPLERNQMRGEHQPEHGISCQFLHRRQDYERWSPVRATSRSLIKRLQSALFPATARKSIFEKPRNRRFRSNWAK